MTNDSLFIMIESMKDESEHKRDEVLKKMMEQKPESNKDFVKRNKVKLKKEKKDVNGHK